MGNIINKIKKHNNSTNARIYDITNIQSSTDSILNDTSLRKRHKPYKVNPTNHADVSDSD